MPVNSPGPRAERWPRRPLTCGAVCLGVAVLATISLAAAPRQAAGVRPAGGSRPAAARPDPAATREMLDRYCVTCHNQRLRTGDLALDTLDVANVGAAPGAWEDVVRKLRTGAMPPAGPAAAGCRGRCRAWWRR